MVIYFICGNLSDGDHLDDPDIDGRIILKWLLSYGMGAWTESILLRIGTTGGLLCT
jgi:hypothetical protein